MFVAAVGELMAEVAGEVADYAPYESDPESWAGVVAGFKALAGRAA